MARFCGTGTAAADFILYQYPSKQSVLRPKQDCMLRQEHRRAGQLVAAGRSGRAAEAPGPAVADPAAAEQAAAAGQAPVAAAGAGAAAAAQAGSTAGSAQRQAHPHARAASLQQVHAPGTCRQSAILSSLLGQQVPSQRCAADLRRGLLVLRRWALARRRLAVHLHSPAPSGVRSAHDAGQGGRPGQPAHRGWATG